jgi:aspartyl/glutamyl-tRNA(Asn/Gln) amidotransferase C subunit
MVHLTSEELKHLQKLSNIQIDDSQQQKFLQKLDPVIQKLEELNQIDTSNIVSNSSIQHSLRTLDDSRDFPYSKDIIYNSKHEIINNSIVIKSVI